LFTNAFYCPAPQASGAGFFCVARRTNLGAMTAAAPSAALSPLGLLRARPALRSYIAITAASEFSAQMLNVAIGWYVYAATRDPLSLAFVGLAQFLPNIGLVLIAGHAADRLDRRRIVGVSLLVQAVCLAAFTAWASVAPPAAAPVYLMLAALGVARAFSFPAMAALQPHVVSEAEFPRAVAISTSVFQICSIAGPALGGVLFGVSGTSAFACATAFYVLAMVQTRFLPRGREMPHADAPAEGKAVLGGVRYIRANRLLLSIISLDLFAVLLGGVTALLPIYASDILAVGPEGLGALRCAPAIGATIIGLVLAHRAIERRAGKLLLGCVAGFGLATVVFALSRDFLLSLAALATLGSFDMVSMVIRQTLLQLATPDAMRGRVSAINGVFIGASAELGEFESGATAALFGTVPAALLGGIGTLIVVALWAWMFPELRRAERLTQS
jgi:MFS family permease